MNKDLSKQAKFRPIIGREVITQGVTYIYNLETDGFYDLLDSPIRYGQLTRNGSTIMKEEKPLYVVPVGSRLKITKVILNRSLFDVPGTEARGILRHALSKRSASKGIRLGPSLRSGLACPERVRKSKGWFDKLTTRHGGAILRKLWTLQRGPSRMP